MQIVFLPVLGVTRQSGRDWVEALTIIERTIELNGSHTQSLTQCWIDEAIKTLCDRNVKTINIREIQDASDSMLRYFMLARRYPVSINFL
jgi:hypothetical protein